MNNLRILNQELTSRRTPDTYSSELYPSRYMTKRGRQVRLFSNPPPRTLPTLKIQVEFLPLLLEQVNVNGMVNGECLERSEWRPFYSLNCRFPPSSDMGTLITAFGRIREDHRPRRTWTDASPGSAEPVVWPAPLGRLWPGN